MSYFLARPVDIQTAGVSIPGARGDRFPKIWSEGDSNIDVPLTSALRRK